VSIPPGNLTLIWFPAGIGLILFMGLGRIAYLWVVLASFAVNGIFIIQGSRFDALSINILFGILIACGDATQSFIAWKGATWLERRLDQGLFSFESHLLPYFLMVCLLPSLLTAWFLVGVPAAISTEPEGVKVIANNILYITIADTLGLLLVGPLYWAWKTRFEYRTLDVRKRCLLAILILSALGLSFVWMPVIVMLIFPLLLIMSRWGQLFDAAVGTLIPAIIMSVATGNKAGLFASYSGPEAFFGMVVFLLALVYVSYSSTLTHSELIDHQHKLRALVEQKTTEVKTLSGLLPICSHCKKIRDDRGYWNQIEEYLHEHSEAEFSHSICIECADRYYPDLDLYDDE